MESVRIIFVLPAKYTNENDASECMIQAYQACKQNDNVDVSWVKEKHFAAFKLNKTDFVIFEEFEGDTFDRLKETKCARILGPWAVSVCLVEGKGIPNFPWPIYNVAMYECVVTSSNFSKKVKLEIKEKVQIMGGCYVDNLVEKVTHLVTDNPKSEKYLAAAETGIALMCSSWIEAVWTASQTANVHAKDQQFEKHRCLPFQNLTICCTGLSGADRKEIETLIVENGGEHTAKLNLRHTDILVCSGIAGATSEKYKAARKESNIKCVDIAWITESVRKGYALPHTDFPVKKVTSTPTKQDRPVDPNFSVLSAIGVPNTSQRIFVEESMLASKSPGHFGSPSKLGASKRKGNLKQDYAQLVDKLDIKKAKKAGQYLDGCSVYITGFSPEHTEKLCKILNMSGATRYDQFSDRLTHVIVGDIKYPEVRTIRSKRYQCLMVTVQWLLDSIDAEQPVNEEKYLLSTSDLEKSSLGSPLSKKGLSLLRSNKTVTELKLDDVAENVEPAVQNPDEDILQKYLKPASMVQEEDTLALLLRNADNTNFTNQIEEPPKLPTDFKPSETSTQRTTTDNEYSSQTVTEMFFEGLRFLVVGFEDDHLDYLKTAIEAFGGQMVPKSFKGIPDYLVVPAFNKSEVHYTSTEVVNEFFIKQCELDGCLLKEICYYHRPLDVPDLTPLENCVITISGYSNLERSFLGSLIESLGGYHQEQFARVRSEARGVVASTHLVSDKPTGKKYTAALKWGLPVVNKDWLLECARTGVRPPEDEFAVQEDTEPSDENKTPAKPVDKAPNPTFGSPLPVATAHNSTPKQLDNSKPSSRVSTPVSEASWLKTKQSCLDTTKTCSRLHNATPNAEPSMSTMNCSQFSTPNAPNVPGSSRNSRVLTPVNQRLPRMSLSDSYDKPFSQVTPVNKIVQQYRESNLDGTPIQDSPDRFRWMGIKTPETPLGACIRADPSPQLRKECEFWLRQFPDFVPPAPRRLSTPLSEIKRQLWDKILKKGEDEDLDQPPFGTTDKPNEPETMDVESEVDEGVEVMAEDTTPPENTQNRLINNKLQQLEEMLSASGAGKRQSRNFQSTIPIPEGNNREYRDSQACTVGWDYQTEKPAQPNVRIFMLSGVAEDVRHNMVAHIESLGATVSELTNYDPSATHLLCPKPARNEKTLACMAAGKWILHVSYLKKCVDAGHFLNEEEYEFGNPKSVGKFAVEYEKEVELRMRQMHYWRQEVTRRGYGAFNDMRAIVFAQKREPIVRVIEAGGGVIIDVSPPFDDTVHATHCLLEQKAGRNFEDYVPLAQQGIYMLNPIYISDYLYQPNKPIMDLVLPYFTKFYSKS